MELKLEQYLPFISKVAEAVEAQRDYITQLDAATGDGDHGLNLSIGYKKVVAGFSEMENAADFKELFTNLAKRMMSSMGGTSGVLYGSMYLAAAKQLENVRVLDAKLLAEMLGWWAESIVQRGNAVLGDKTMLDVLSPAVKEYAAALDAGMDDMQALEVLKKAAGDGAEATKGMEAKRGRASNQPGKGVGHLDPGAVTMAMMLEILADYLVQNCI